MKFSDLPIPFTRSIPEFTPRKVLGGRNPAFTEAQNEVLDAIDVMDQKSNWGCGAALGIGLFGCTVTPKVVEAQTVGYDGAVQDGGIRAKVPGGFIISEQLRAKYNLLIEKWATDGLLKKAHVQPSVKKDSGILPDGGDSYFIDNEHMALLARLSLLDRSGIQP